MSFRAALVLICLMRATLLSSILSIAVPALADGQQSDGKPIVVPRPAQDYLDPEQPTPADLIPYETKVRTRFKDAFSADIQIRMLAEPSFSPEYAVGIRLDGEIYSVVYLKAAESFWYNPKTSSPVTHCEVTISPPLAQRLFKVWKRMVLNVPAHGEPLSVGLDGEEYYFAVRVGSREHTAQTWSPNDGTAPAMLVRLGSTLTNYCTTKGSLFLEPASWYFEYSLDAQLNKLTKRLDAKPDVK